MGKQKWLTPEKIELEQIGHLEEYLGGAAGDRKQ